jgi:RNA polymerase sigma factor (sigma-70 family)
LVDHLFRHQYGKMVAILANIFGLQHLELVEDAVQDTFLQASLKWREAPPENPEAWLRQASKHRVLDLMRQIKARQKREELGSLPQSGQEIDDYFLDHELRDSQLRMLFVACNPAFSRSEQIAFALKAISGFSGKEIASALLQKEETIKKRLVRARLKIKELGIELEYPDASAIKERQQGVMQVIYLIFNEGFHSNKIDQLVDKELCGEALRLCKLLLSKESFRSGALYGLFALLCYNSARIDAKVQGGKVIDLKNQDRSIWYTPLIELGHNALSKGFEHYTDRSSYHFEALIAAEHLRAKTFAETDWSMIIRYYDMMYAYLKSAHIPLAQCNAHLQLKNLSAARDVLHSFKPEALGQRAYLYHATYADYHILNGEKTEGIKQLEKAIKLCSNQLELNFLARKRQEIMLL